MSHGPDLPLPTARSLQGWWRELAGLRPKRLWFGRLLFHHLEALVEIPREIALDPLQRVLLCAVAAGASGLASFDPQIRARLLQELTHAGLLVAEGTGWQVTPAGRASATTGSCTRTCRERRSFWFVNGTPPTFLQPQRSLDATATPEDWSFPAAALGECVRQSADWKQQSHFPADVQTIVDYAATAGDWRAVMIDRAEQFRGIVVEAMEGPALAAYAVRSDTWGLEREPPAFTLSAGWEEVLPDLAVEPAPEIWRQAWLAWCQPRGVLEAEANTCQLEREGHRLLVRAPKQLAERLRTARGEPLKNEAWLLAGTGRFRAAAQLEVTESHSI